MTKFRELDIPNKIKKTLIKEPSKLQSIKRACAINDSIFKEIIKKFDQFLTEKDIEQYILKRFIELGVESAYPLIVANNNSVIHAKPRKTKLVKGFLILDFGAKVNRYCSDMTRTVFIGKANQRQKQLYHMVLLAQEACIHQAKYGTICGEIDALARQLLGKYRDNFVHGLGHGLGYKVHIKPFMKPDSLDKLKEGDFVTIEPGIYIKNNKEEFGIRIEDTLYIGKRTKVLTRAPKKDLIEVSLK